MPATQISVVVPVYNGERDLAACLASIGRSVARLSEDDRGRVEVIVCDNWSTDASAALAGAAKFTCAYRVVRPDAHEKNRTRNWRAGLSYAEGRWMMMVHADDLMAPACLPSLMAATATEGAGDVDLVVGRHRTFEDPMEPSGLHPRFAFPSVIPGQRLLREVMPFHCPFVPFILMRRDAYLAIGGLDDRWELVQDWDLWIRMCRNGDVLALTAEVGWWRTHGTPPGYRRVNAREHVALADALDLSAPEIPSANRERAKRLARAKAAVHLAGDPEAVSAEEARAGKLPSIGDARTMLRRLNGEVAVRQLRLRLAGMPGAARLRLSS